MEEFKRIVEAAWIALLSGLGSFTLMTIAFFAVMYWLNTWTISCAARACLFIVK